MDRRKIIQVAVGVVALVAIVAGLYVLSSVNNQDVEHVVTISSCDVISPSTLTVQGGEVVVFENVDTVEHTIELGEGIVRIPAGDKARVSTQLQYGPGTYAYTCDGAVNAGQIQVTSTTQPQAGTPTFREAYEIMTESQQACVKEVLGNGFEEAYNKPDFDFTGLTDRLNKCLLATGGQE